jgi:vacuolar-type H+-ATPase subunit H
MGKIVKGIVLGAAVGAGIRVAQDLKSEDDLGAIAPRVAKSAGEAALAGAAVGVLLTARDRRRMKKMRKSMKGAAKLRSYAETGLQVAVPALQHAADYTRPRVEHAYEAAKPRVEHAYEVAKPRVEHAAKEARKRAEKAAETARPKVEKAARDARERATNVADLATERAKRKLADLDLPTAVIAV